MLASPLKILFGLDEDPVHGVYSDSSNHREDRAGLFILKLLVKEGPKGVDLLKFGLVGLFELGVGIFEFKDGLVGFAKLFLDVEGAVGSGQEGLVLETDSVIEFEASVLHLQ